METSKRIKTDTLLPTASVDEKKVKQWAEQFRDSENMPPIKYIVDPDDGQKYIVDGNSKWFSSLLRNDEYVNAIEWEDLPEGIKNRFLKRIKE